MYNSLHHTGFSHNQIEQAMNNTVLYGGDLMDALDWLCLNLADGNHNYVENSDLLDLFPSIL